MLSRYNFLLWSLFVINTIHSSLDLQSTYTDTSSKKKYSYSCYLSNGNKNDMHPFYTSIFVKILFLITIRKSISDVFAPILHNSFKSSKYVHHFFN